MPYEIPQNLKYVEKIFFGLTFWQLFWLGLFGGIAAIIFFKVPEYFYPKAIVCVLLLGLGVGFAFSNFWGHARDYNTFRKSVRKAGFFDSKLQNFVGVKKIEDNAIYLPSGALRAIIEVFPINFSILSAVEQKAVISAYKDFLNSLDFPIQIVMRTTSLNLDEYLLDLWKSVLQLNNQELEKEFDSFKQFLEKFIQENSVKNRVFYVVLPYSPYAHSKPLQDILTSLKNTFSRNKKKNSVALNKEIALNQLNVRVELCKEKLKKCGLLTQRLDNQQLLGLLTSFFDSHIQANNQYFYPLTLLESFSSDANEQD